jgi:hypothetical protein
VALAVPFAFTALPACIPLFRLRVLQGYRVLALLLLVLQTGVTVMILEGIVGQSGGGQGRLFSLLPALGEVVLHRAFFVHLAMPEARQTAFPNGRWPVAAGT